MSQTPTRVFIQDVTLRDGMHAVRHRLSPENVAKIAGALDAAKSGVNTVHIIDGRVPHAMLLEILSDQAYGTMIRSH